LATASITFLASAIFYYSGHPPSYILTTASVSAFVLSLLPYLSLPYLSLKIVDGKEANSFYNNIDNQLYLVFRNLKLLENEKQFTDQATDIADAASRIFYNPISFIVGQKHSSVALIAGTVLGVCSIKSSGYLGLTFQLMGTGSSLYGLYRMATLGPKSAEVLRNNLLNIKLS
jgi:hypothetical protein